MKLGIPQSLENIEKLNQLIDKLEFIISRFSLSMALLYHFIPQNEIDFFALDKTKLDRYVRGIP